MKKLGTVQLQKVSNNNPRAYKLSFTEKKDIKALGTIARRHFNIKSKKKRIVYKYIRKLFNFLLAKELVLKKEGQNDLPN